MAQLGVPDLLIDAREVGLRALAVLEASVGNLGQGLVVDHDAPLLVGLVLRHGLDACFMSAMVIPVSNRQLRKVGEVDVDNSLGRRRQLAVSHCQQLPCRQPRVGHLLPLGSFMCEKIFTWELRKVRRSRDGVH